MTKLLGFINLNIYLVIFNELIFLNAIPTERMFDVLFWAKIIIKEFFRKLKPN